MAYSYRLNTSYHPRYRFGDDIRGVDGRALVLVGEDDEALDPDALRALFSREAPNAEFEVMPQIDHFGVFSNPRALETISRWIRGV